MSGSTQQHRLYQELIRCMATTLRCDFALIGILDETGARVVPIAVADPDEPEKFEYQIEGTPCEVTLRDGPFIVRAGAWAKFPEDETLVQMRSEAYLSHPFEDPITGRKGIIAAIRRDPLDESADVLPILSAFAESVTSARLSGIVDSDNTKLAKALDSGNIGFAVVDRGGIFIRGNKRARPFFCPRDDGTTVLSEPRGAGRDFGELRSAIRERRRWAGRFEVPAFCNLHVSAGLEPPAEQNLVIEAEVTPLFDGPDDRSTLVLRDCTAVARREQRLMRDATEQRVYASVLDALQRQGPLGERARDAFRAILEFPEYECMRAVRFEDGRVTEIASVPPGPGPWNEIDDTGLPGIAATLDLHAEALLSMVAADEPRDDTRAQVCLTPIRHQGSDIGAILYGVRPGYRRGGCHRVMPRMIEDMFANAMVRDQLESGLREALDEARQACEAKSLFLANMSHELRTPISAILGFSEMLAFGSEDGDAAQHDQITGIQRNAGRLLALVSDILDLGKIESGTLSVEREPCGVATICDEVLSRHAGAAMAKGLEISAEYNGHEDLVLFTDGSMFDQILSNLVGNAIKFTERGRVTISVSCDKNDGRVRIDVSDTGIGIAECHQQDLFEPFRQADDSYSRPHGGTGLGLSICRDLVACLGGTIDVTSRQGEGSVFTVSLPRRHDDMVNSECRFTASGASASEFGDVRQRGEAALGGKRVLVAEDGADNRTLFDFYLRRVGAKTVFADNGEQAVERVLRAHDGCGFDLIVMDIQMPAMDGHEATRRLRDSGVTTPILAVTAHALTSDRDRCFAAGCDGYLTKPVDFERFIESCIRLIEPGCQEAA